MPFPRFTSSRRNSQLDKQVSELSSASSDIEEGFHWVKDKLEGIKDRACALERKRIPDGFSSEDIEEHLEKWNTYYNKCKTLLWDSRKVAGKIQTASTGFSQACNELLLRPTASVQENRAEIADCIKLLQEHEASSYKICQEFKDLRRGVKNFRDRWENFVRAEFESKPALARSSGGLLSGFKDNFGNLTLKIGVASTAFIILTAITGGVSTLTNNMNKIPVQTNSSVSPILQSDAQLEGADVIRSIDSDGDIFGEQYDAICSRLAVLCNLWATVSADIRAVENDLIVLGYSEKVDERFRKKLTRIRDSYEKLGAALYRYQTEVIS